MPNKGTIRGTHHLTFCVGGAQEDYDFHVRLLGLRSVKKTVLFDGEIPIYHLYYGNREGDASTLLTSFPYRQAGWMGKRGTNQLKTLMLSVPASATGFWADRLSDEGRRRTRSSRASARSASASRTRAASRTRSSASPTTTRARPTRPTASPPTSPSAAPTARRARSASPICRPSSSPRAWAARRPARRASTTSSRSAPTRATGGSSSSSRSPTSPQGSWTFGEGTIHHQAFDVSDADNQQVVKDWLVGLGFTDVSESKDRGYFFSMYMRSPGGALCELAWSTEAGFTIDESVEEFGTHMCIPPHWEDRRSEISQLEPIETDEVVVSGA